MKIHSPTSDNLILYWHIPAILDKPHTLQKNKKFIIQSWLKTDVNIQTLTAQMFRSVFGISTCPQCTHS